jgi:hypothetical protein
MPVHKTESATWWDYHELTFWVWACLRNANIYLKIADNAFNEGYVEQLREIELAKYHFIAAMGVLIRVLQRAQHLFPSIQPAYSKATHLISEGKHLRDMIEHAYGKDGYLAGGGKYPSRFMRCRGDMVADATSTIVTDDGHWLGNRLNVETIVREVEAIKSIADQIVPPRDD